MFKHPTKYIFQVYAYTEEREICCQQHSYLAVVPLLLPIVWLYNEFGEDHPWSYLCAKTAMSAVRVQKPVESSGG